MKNLIFNRLLLCLFMTVFLLFTSCSSDDATGEDGPVIDNGDPFTSVVTDDSLLLDGNSFPISKLIAFFQTQDGKTLAGFNLLSTPNATDKNTLNILLEYNADEALDGTYNLVNINSGDIKEVNSLTNFAELSGNNTTNTYSVTEARVEVKNTANRNYTLTVSITLEKQNTQGSETPETRTFTGTIVGKFITTGTHL